MFDSLRSRLPGHATLIAYAALFTVLGGGAYAAFDPVGGDGDVDLCFEKKSGDLDIQKGARCDSGERALALNQAGSQGPQGVAGPEGAQGETGAQGQQGIQGVQGPSGTANLVTREGTAFTVSNDLTNAGNAACQAGEKAVSGGHELVSGIPGDMIITRSAPTQVGTTPTSWNVTVFNADVDGSNSGAVQVKPIVVCAQ